MATQINRALSASSSVLKGGRKRWSKHQSGCFFLPTMSSIQWDVLLFTGLGQSDFPTCWLLKDNEDTHGQTSQCLPEPLAQKHLLQCQTHLHQSGVHDWNVHQTLRKQTSKKVRILDQRQRTFICFWNEALKDIEKQGHLTYCSFFYLNTFDQLEWLCTASPLSLNILIYTFTYMCISKRLTPVSFAYPRVLLLTETFVLSLCI